MPVIDLNRYLFHASGTWTEPDKDERGFTYTLSDTMAPGRFMLRWPGDFVALTGPLRVRVTVQAESLTLPLAMVRNLVPAFATSQANSTLGFAALNATFKDRTWLPQASTIYSYELDIPAGEAWPFSLSDYLETSTRPASMEKLGNNLGLRVVIEPAFAFTKPTPVTTRADLPCDFAVADQPNSASFFPVACEPCEGTVIGLPPSDAVSLVIPPAEGGCVRTRFFNGMFITREDLETEQRYHRLKSKLHNRASGSGVVWGLRVGKESGKICVMPGYGVDCCGNDLALTTTYKVDIAALMADPAAAPYARNKGSHCLQLMLEYVECPSDPRPVHGDPCLPDAARCEMSRVRESVRLRLVPPRECDPTHDSEPVGQFLNDIRSIREQFSISLKEQYNGVARAPFTLKVEIFDINGGIVGSATIRPEKPSDQISIPSVPTDQIRLTLDPDPYWKFVGGQAEGRLDDSSGAPGLPDSVDPSGSFDLGVSTSLSDNSKTVTFSQIRKLPQSRLDFQMRGWQAQTLFASDEDAAIQGDLRVTIEFRDAQVVRTRLEFPAPRFSAIAFAKDPCQPQPCRPNGDQRLRGAGDGRSDPLWSAARFNSLAGLLNSPLDAENVLPWLHADPENSDRAGDPKVLILAALGGWLSQMLVREKAGASDEVMTWRRELAQLIYRAGWLFLFGISNDVNPTLLGGILQRLLEGWCNDLLWDGPECCGDPHGVVIGSVMIDSGTIQSIDPYQGRRHVVHYPLLAHWGSQFGLAPLDVTASGLFSKICCLATLSRTDPNPMRQPGRLDRLGAGYLAVGEPEVYTKFLNEQKIQIASTKHVALPEWVIALLLALRSPQERESNNRYDALVLKTFVADQTVMLLIPAL